MLSHRPVSAHSRSSTIRLIGAALPQTPWGEPALRFVRLTGREALGQDFAYDITAQSLDDPEARIAANDLDLRALVGTELTVAVALDGSGSGAALRTGRGVRYLSGIVTQARQLSADARHVRYEFRVEPWLALAKRRSNYAHFQELSAPEIIERVLSGYGFLIERRLSARYPKRSYQVQYGETDYAFTVRLMQEWGITHFWEHGNGTHRLVLVDSMGAYRRTESAAYHVLRIYPPDTRIDEEHLARFDTTERLRSGEWITSDYDFERPRADLSTAHAAPRGTAHDKHIRYEWPGDYVDETDADGGMRAHIRMEEERSRGRRVHGGGNLRGIATGTTFTVTGHTRTELNAEFVTISTTLRLEETADESGAEQPYRCAVDFAALPATEIFRPRRTMRKPRTHGPVSAIVVGPPDQEVWTDQYGRVRVQFPWDRVGTFDPASSPWIRVNYPNAGENAGAIHIPRIGQEVTVDHFGGDPDRPFISGCAYNADNMPPWTLPAQQALSGYRSREHHGQGRNHLLFDDTLHQQQVQLATPHQHSALTLGHNVRVATTQGRQDKRGEGFELRTDAWGALRAGWGLLITTVTRRAAARHQNDMTEAQRRLQSALALHQSAAQLAQHHKAQADEQAKTADALDAQSGAIRGSGEPLAELSAPHLVLDSAAGIAMTAADAIHLASGTHTAITSGGHTSVAAKGGFFASALAGLGLFAHRLGMRLIAASGDVDIQAQAGRVLLTSNTDVVIRCKRFIVEAEDEILHNAAGTYQRMNANNITDGMRGVRTVHAADWAILPPAGLPVGKVALPASEVCIECLLKRARERAPLVLPRTA